MCKDKCVWACEKKNDALCFHASTYSEKYIGCGLANSDQLVNMFEVGQCWGKDAWFTLLEWRLNQGKRLL